MSPQLPCEPERCDQRLRRCRLVCSACLVDGGWAGPDPGPENPAGGSFLIHEARSLALGMRASDGPVGRTRSRSASGAAGVRALVAARTARLSGRLEPCTESLHKVDHEAFLKLTYIVDTWISEVYRGQSCPISTSLDREPERRAGRTRSPANSRTPSSRPSLTLGR